MKEKLKKIKDKALPFIQKNKRKIIIIGSALVVMLSIVVMCAIYVGDYYHADEAAETMIGTASYIEVQELKKGVTVFAPTNAEAGFIFYPGGKVEHTAYAPLMYALAKQGVLAVLCEMPFNLAVLDVNAADGITEQFPDIDNWYIGGHSLGGSMAASYLANNTDKFDGLVLLGSYSTASLTESRVLSIYGSEDRVMNREKYEKYKNNLPSDFSEIIIAGGNHAYFGMYGEQDGDGKATLTPIEQITKTADSIGDFIKNKRKKNAENY